MRAPIAAALRRRSGGARLLVLRLSLSLTTILLVASAAFILAGLAPGDFTTTLGPRSLDPRVRASQQAVYGLDRPVWAQYVDWCGRLTRLDFGPSLLYGRPVSALLAERAGNTLRLAGGALALAFGLGLPLGMVTASRRPRPVARIVTFVSLVGVSLPPMALALALAVLGVRAGWFVVGDSVVLPMIAVALPMAASVERLFAQGMAAALRAPHVGAARARGVSEWALVCRHATWTALAPLLGVFAVLMASVLSGSFGVEVVTAWPGLGRLAFDALAARDVNLVAGCAVTAAAFVTSATFLGDVLAPWCDPTQRTTQ
ncbi:MAG: ABC transporter permease [Vicinamibacterales bacterium]